MSSSKTVLVCLALRGMALCWAIRGPFITRSCLSLQLLGAVQTFTQQSDQKAWATFQKRTLTQEVLTLNKNKKIMAGERARLSTHRGASSLLKVTPVTPKHLVAV